MKEAAIKKYIVRLNADERERLNALINAGKHAARKLLKARILLKADVSAGSEGWSDSQIAQALDTSSDTVFRTRQRMVEEGLDAALAYKYSPASARPRIFDGAAEAKLIALACGTPPKGGGLDGPCNCWKNKSWNSRSLNGPATTRSAGRSKKYSQATPPKTVGDRPRCQRSVRGCDGRRARSLSKAA